MKSFIQIFLVCLVSCSYAQIPNGYYNSATGSGYTLKTQLYNIINGHNSPGGYDGLWTTYATSDRDNQYENDNTIFDLYSENPIGSDPVTFIYISDQCGSYNSEGDCYNREHVIPQSIFNSASPMLSDAHFVIPVDGYVNGQRSDNPHGKVATAAWTSLNGSKRGSSMVSGYTGTVFEPLNDFKGDIARMYFYFVTRYENVVAGYASYPMFNGTSNQAFAANFLTMLIDWHNQDPVSAREIARNNAIYARQNNRNPFIDNPSYVASIWAPTPINQTITFNALPNQVYGNPSLLLTAISTSGLPISYMSSNTNIAQISGNTLSFLGVGNVTITATQAGNSSYNPATPVQRTFNIAQKAITFSGVVNNKVYDGTANATISGSLSGIINNDNVNFIGTGSFMSINAGTSIAVSSTSYLTGLHAFKYTLVQPNSLSGNILPKMVFIH